MLIVVDMQKDFLTGALKLPYDPTDLIDSVANAIRLYPGLVAVFQDEHPLAENDPEIQQLGISHCVPGTDGYDFPDAIKKAIQDRENNPDQTPVAFFKKKSYAGIQATEELLSYAKENGHQNDNYDFCGVATHICVHDTLAAFYHGFKELIQEKPIIRVLTKLVGDFDPEMEKYALKRMTKLYDAELI